MKRIFTTKNLCCANCAAKMENKIKKIPGVKDAGISVMTQKMFIDADDDKFDNVFSEAFKICKKIESDIEIV